MAYVTSADLVERFGQQEIVQLSDRTNKPPTTIDASVVGRACDDASAFADSYLAARYDLPLGSVPQILVRQTADIARYYLWGKAAEVGGPIERAYAQAAAWFVNVSKGLVKLEIAGGETAPVSAKVVAQISVSEPIFTRDFRGI